MKQILSLLFRSFLLCFVLFVCVLSFKVHAPLYAFISLAAAALSIILGLSIGLKAGWLLGFGLVFAPILGRGVFPMIWASFLLGHSFGTFFEEQHKKEVNNPSRELQLTALFSAFLAFLFPIIAPYILDFDWLVVSDVLKRGGVIGFHQFWSSDPGAFVRALQTLSGYLLILIHVEILSAEQDVSRAVTSILRGFCYGLLISLFALMLQLSGIELLGGFGNFTKYWKTVGQYPATATDPNALGVSCALLFPLFSRILEPRRSVLILTFTATIILGLFSGSRTFLLGVIFASGILVYYWVKRQKRRELTICYVIGIAGALSAVVLFGYPSLNNKLQTLMPFPSSVRVLRSIHWNDSASMFSSRAIFSKVAVRAWKESPIIGLGLERFYDAQRNAMDKLGINLGGWVDNANNFYLQVLAEGGILGVSLIFLAIVLMSVIALARPLSEDELKELVKGTGLKFPSLELQSRARICVGVFSLLLLTGPHLLLPEVQFLFGTILAAAYLRPVILRNIEMGQIRLGVQVVLFLFSLGYLIISVRDLSAPKTRGFYSPDNPLAPMVRWSAGQGRIELCNNEADTVKFKIRSLRPQISKYPVRVLLHEGETDVGDTTQDIELTNAEWLTIIVPLRPDANGKFSKAVVKFQVAPVWSPSQLKVGDDPRWLGVQVQLPEKIC